MKEELTSVTDDIEIMKEELTRLCKLHELCLNNLTDVIKKAGEHFSLLLKWNQKISLTTITNPKLAAIQLYFESLFAAKIIDDKIKSMIDVGTGAGFPGIPLALALPNMDICLIEADQRKFAFLGEARRSIKINNLTIINHRFQKVFCDSNLVTVRALEKLQTQIPHLLKFAAKSKLIILFVSHSTAEKILLTYQNQLSLYKKEITPLPESQNRVLLLLYNMSCST
jgi:16S rRNA (guanine527-N7)-methyltransferase